jgi:hypothetical protein
MKTVNLFLIIATFFIGCSNESNQIIGKYERRLYLTGCAGIDRIEFIRDKSVVNWAFDYCGTGKLHLSEIRYGNWILIKNRIEIYFDSLYAYDNYEQLSQISKKISIDSIYNYDYKLKQKSNSGYLFDHYKRVLLLTKDTSQSFILLAKDNDPIDAWKIFTKIK